MADEYRQGMQAGAFGAKESEAEGRFRALVANHALGILEVGVDGRITLVNRTVCDWTGIDGALLDGRALADVTPAEDHATLVRQLERLAAGSIDGTSVTHRLRNGAGIDLWVRTTWSVRRSGGAEVTHLIAIVENIARQREDELVRSILEESIRRLEERRRFVDAMVAGLPVVAWRALPNGICQYLSPQWCALTGMRDGTGLRWLAAIHPDDRETCVAAWRGVDPIRTDPGRVGLSDARRFRCRVSDAGGAFHRFEIAARPIRDADDAITAWSGVFIPIVDHALADTIDSRLDLDLPEATDLPRRILTDPRSEPPDGISQR